MKKFVALYDACVLYPAPLRDLLMHLALIDLYQAKWTNAIHINRLDLKRAQLEQIKNLMNTHALECLVDGYEQLIPSLRLPDPDDRHVLAAAIHSSASIIITYNLKDFPHKTLDMYAISANTLTIF